MLPLLINKYQTNTVKFQWLEQENFLSWKCMLCLLIRIASSTYYYFTGERKAIPKLSPFSSWPGALINPQWLELPMSRTNSHGPKDVRAIEVRLYVPMNSATKAAPLCWPGHQATFKRNDSQKCRTLSFDASRPDKSLSSLDSLF